MAAKRLTKAQLFAELAEATELPKKKVAEVFDALSEVMKKQLTGRGPGEFVLPGLLKVRVVKRPATKEREGINPQTREKITIPAKPASKRVRATALKGLKEMVL
ncbi:MAG: HU family DNA-binding protein [Myxococcales bacterium]|jgi:DNA-binding protein HU-beta|nr:HU family DNA-binding protein [Myxococcales bacterium]